METLNNDKILLNNNISNNNQQNIIAREEIDVNKLFGCCLVALFKLFQLYFHLIFLHF